MCSCVCICVLKHFWNINQKSDWSAPCFEEPPWPAPEHRHCPQPFSAAVSVCMRPTGQSPPTSVKPRQRRNSVPRHGSSWSTAGVLRNSRGIFETRVVCHRDCQVIKTQCDRPSIVPPATADITSGGSTPFLTATKMTTGLVARGKQKENLHGNFWTCVQKHQQKIFKCYVSHVRRKMNQDKVEVEALLFTNWDLWPLACLF